MSEGRMAVTDQDRYDVEWPRNGCGRHMDPKSTQNAPANEQAVESRTREAVWPGQYCKLRPGKAKTPELDIGNCSRKGRRTVLKRVICCRRKICC